MKSLLVGADLHVFMEEAWGFGLKVAKSTAFLLLPYTDRGRQRERQIQTDRQRESICTARLNMCVI